MADREHATSPRCCPWPSSCRMSERTAGSSVRSSGHQRGERRVSQAVELAGRHVACAGRMIIHRVVEAVQGEQFVAELAEKVLVAHPALDVFGGGSELVLPFRLNVAFLVEAIDAAETFGVHEISRV